MDMLPETPNQVDAGLLAAPVIIPLQWARDESAATERPPRFEFPELTSTGKESPKVIWPECGRPKTVRACAELAGSICWRLPPDRPVIVAFTSPGDGDGKTSLLLGLAPELAKRIEGGVLVVDASFRKSNLTARLAISADQTPLDAASIYATNLSGLSVLPAPAVAHWIEHLREGWPLVLVDTPSLEHVEAATMLRRCDGVYLIVRLGHTARRAVAEAARVIERSGGRLLGCVVVE